MRFALLVTTLLYSTATTTSRTGSLPQSTEGSPSLAEAEFDWNADGAPDRFRRRPKKKRATPPRVPAGPLRERSPRGTTAGLLFSQAQITPPLREEEWSVKDADLLSFREILDFRDARGFFGNWFTWKLLDANNQTSLMNSFEVRRVTPEDISDEVLLAETKRLKIEASPAQLKREMLNERALRIFVYRASRREDVRSSRLYSKSAKSHAVRYGFPD